MVALAKALIEWRRRGICCRVITLVIDGDDEVYELVYPKDISRGMAEAVARRELARVTDTPLKFVHVTHSEVRNV